MNEIPLFVVKGYKTNNNQQKVTSWTKNVPVYTSGTMDKWV